MHPSRPSRPFLLAALVMAGSLAAPTLARAADPADDAALEPGAGTPRPPAPDGRTGHLFLYPRLAFISGVGSLASPSPTAALAASTATSDVIGGGFNVGGVIGVGIGRSASLQLDGGYSAFGNPADCQTCRGTSLDVGLGLTYHLAQGIAVDAWGSYGFGVRSQKYTVRNDLGADPTTTNVREDSYLGLDFARLALGADFYPTPFFGLGPYFEADVGTNLSRPDPTATASVYAFFQVGLRLAFDPFRRAPAPAAAPATTQARLP